MTGSAPASAVMRTLADPTRLAIYERIIGKREASVGELTQFARVSQPAVSQHLKVLQQANLIAGRRDGRTVLYSALPEGLEPLAKWVKHYEQFWNESFDRLDDYLRELQRNEKKRGRKK